MARKQQPGLKPPPAERVRFLQSVSDAHDSWVDSELDGDLPFKARKRGSDYPEHHLDVEASAEMLESGVPNAWMRRLAMRMAPAKSNGRKP